MNWEARQVTRSTQSTRSDSWRGTIRTPSPRETRVTEQFSTAKGWPGALGAHGSHAPVARSTTPACVSFTTATTMKRDVFFFFFSGRCFSSDVVDVDVFNASSSSSDAVAAASEHAAQEQEYAPRAASRLHEQRSSSSSRQEEHPVDDEERLAFPAAVAMTLSGGRHRVRARKRPAQQQSSRPSKAPATRGWVSRHRACQRA
mmetsp:Transcript_23757/g.73144  ORF Transcript_23757/g.73144 Transcript_23757/m.73144 type:complete len:202 (+) Transcript_23757:774-1379(+)